MTDNDFIAMILADPTDDTRRQVYADWLEEKADPRARFLRLQPWWNENRRHPRRPKPNEFVELRAALDPDWVAVMSTVALPGEPLPFDFDADDDLPFNESFVIRRTSGRYGQPGGLVTFASQFRQVSSLDADFASDLRLLSELDWSLLGCYRGASEFCVFPFLAELRSATDDPRDVAQQDLLDALGARWFRPDDVWEDWIGTDEHDQMFFPYAEDVDNLDEDDDLLELQQRLKEHVAPGTLWYVLIRTAKGRDGKHAVHFAIGPSRDGERLLGLVAGGYW